jgi:hypothetical protein
MFDSFSLLSLVHLVRERFDVKNLIVWDKMLLGMGHHFRRRHELVLFASKGKRPLARRDLPDVWRIRRIARAPYPTAAQFQSIIDFVVEREGKEAARYHHVWDRWDGRYRLEGVNREGHAVLALFNVQKPGTGREWLDGRELTGEELTKALERAYGRFINDTYWLLMPAKMLDPGVSLASEGEAERDGRKYDVVRLTFCDSCGLTPKDTYWAFVSKESGLMERWEMVLTGQEAKDRSAYTWTDWQTVGGVRLALTKTAVEGGAVIRFDHVSGGTSTDDAAFAK